jgi:hypothetical protein
VPFTLKNWTKCWTSHVTTKGPTTFCTWLEWQHALGRASSSCFRWKDPRGHNSPKSKN